jgi:hypothetical protein
MKKARSSEEDRAFVDFRIKPFQAFLPFLGFGGAGALPGGGAGASSTFGVPP